MPDYKAVVHPKRLGLTLPVGPDVRSSIEWARRAEALGYESLWIAEAGGPDPFVLAGCAAQVTARARIGLAVSPVYTRTPATIAAAAATVSQLAPGRFVLGLGASSHAIVGNWHGLKFEKPLARVRETVAAVRGMLRGEKVQMEGETLRTRGFRLASPPASPVPIYLGALKPAMLELAGEAGDGVVLNLFPVEALPRMLKHFSAGAARAGKDGGAMEVVCRHIVLVSDDKAAARDLFRLVLTGYFATPVYNRYAAWYGFEEEAELIARGFATGDRELTRKGMSDRFVDALGIFGSLQECRERIAAYAESGVTTTAVSVLSFDPQVIEATVEGLAPGW